MIRRLLLAATVALCSLGSLAFAHSSDWVPIGSGILSGVSGMAIHARGAGATVCVVVRDNKLPEQNRAALVTVLDDNRPPKVEPLVWSGETPVDLEAIDNVPGHFGEYVALASDGRAFHLKIENGKATVLRAFPLPPTNLLSPQPPFPPPAPPTVPLPPGPPIRNYEAFALTIMDGRTIAVWADRADDKRPSIVFAATLDLESGAFGPVTTATFRAPYPLESARHISDVKIEPSGAILVSAASDHGDDGPFDSAVYIAGTIAADNNRVKLTASLTPTRLLHFASHKIEALALLPGPDGGLFLGTDDENYGGWLWTSR